MGAGADGAVDAHVCAVFAGDEGVARLDEAGFQEKAERDFGGLWLEAVLGEVGVGEGLYGCDAF